MDLIISLVVSGYSRVFPLPTECRPGQPLGELPILGQNLRLEATVKRGMNDKRVPRTPSSVNFVRSRMMYARASTNVKGDVHFGLRHNREYMIIEL